MMQTSLPAAMRPGRYLFTAEPCDDTDPAPGVRLIRAGEVLGRLSPDEARALAADLLAATGDPVSERT